MLFYNPVAFNKLLFRKHPLREDYQTFYLNRGTICKFDRSGLFKKFELKDERFSMKSIFELPTYDPNYNLNFEETCFKRAKQLIDENEKLNLYWSGGLDSTVVLLVMHQFKEQVQSKLKIVMTVRSIADNPQVYEDVIKDNYEHVVLDKFSERVPHWSLEHPNVTGDISEAIYGWSGMFQLFVTKYGMDVAYVNINDIDKLKNTMTEKDFRDFKYFWKLHHIINETYSASPIKVEKLIDLNWWFVYNFCYQYDYLRFMVPCYENYKLPFKYTEPFYAHDDFDNWAVNNYDTVIRGIPDVRVWKIDEINLINKYFPGIQLADDMFPRKTNVDLADLAPKNFLMIDDDYNLVKCPPKFDSTLDEIRMFYGKEYSEEEIIILFD